MIAGVASDLRDRGFAIVEGVIPDPVLTSYTGEIASNLANASAAVRSRESVYAIRNLLDVAPLTHKLVELPVVQEILTSVLGEEARVVRAILFDKPRSANWSVPWHQDRTIAVRAREDVPGFTSWTRKAGVVHVQPPAELLERMLTVRLQLDDALDDGVLRVIAGSHLRGFIRDPEVASVAAGETIECAVPQGGALLMKPLLLHSSASAKAARHRRVVHLEFAAGPLPEPLAWALEA